jgi:hypothetical protein
VPSSDATGKLLEIGERRHNRLGTTALPPRALDRRVEESVVIHEPGQWQAGDAVPDHS